MVVRATYHKARDSELWHFCMNCSDWPAKDFDELSSAQNEPGERICAECNAGRAAEKR